MSSRGGQKTNAIRTAQEQARKKKHSGTKTQVCASTTSLWPSHQLHRINTQTGSLTPTRCGSRSHNVFAVTALQEHTHTRTHTRTHTHIHTHTHTTHTHTRTHTTHLMLWRVEVHQQKLVLRPSLYAGLLHPHRHKRRVPLSVHVLCVCVHARVSLRVRDMAALHITVWLCVCVCVSVCLCVCVCVCVCALCNIKMACLTPSATDSGCCYKPVNLHGNMRAVLSA